MFRTNFYPSYLLFSLSSSLHLSPLSVLVTYDTQRPHVLRTAQSLSVSARSCLHRLRNLFQLSFSLHPWIQIKMGTTSSRGTVEWGATLNRRKVQSYTKDKRTHKEKRMFLLVSQGDRPCIFKSTLYPPIASSPARKSTRSCASGVSVVS